MVSKGNHPQMAARFRLVKYYNLPRCCWTSLRDWFILILNHEMPEKSACKMGSPPHQVTKSIQKRQPWWVPGCLRKWSKNGEFSIYVICINQLLGRFGFKNLWFYDTVYTWRWWTSICHIVFVHSSILVRWFSRMKCSCVDDCSH